MVRTLAVVTAAALLAVTFACSGGEEPLSPASPTVGLPADADAAPDGSTLKVTAPEPVAPANAAELDEFEVLLRVNPATPKFTSSIQLTYRFQLLEGNTVIRQSTSSSARTWRLTDLENDTTYGWRARAEHAGAFGPWSAIRTFRTPDEPEGYSRPGELYDPLVNGKTVGRRIGSTTFVPGKGIKLNGFTAAVEYSLARTVENGEFSMIITGLSTKGPGVKTKVMAMREGLDDIITNNRRMTIDKRSSGIIAWRFISHFSIIDTGPDQRTIREFNPNRDYLWVTTWRNQRFQLEIYEGVPNGRLMYRMGEPYEGEYDPSPHYVYVGAPVGRSGATSASVPDMIARHVWVSERPRPAFANR